MATRGLLGAQVPSLSCLLVWMFLSGCSEAADVESPSDSEPEELGGEADVFDVLGDSLPDLPDLAVGEVAPDASDGSAQSDGAAEVGDLIGGPDSALVDLSDADLAGPDLYDPDLRNLDTIDQWNCLPEGMIPLPPATSEVEYWVRTTARGDGRPLEGTRITLCSQRDVDCSSPVVEMTTGSDGWALGRLPLGEFGLRAAFRFEHGDHLPLTIYSGVPIRRGTTREENTDITLFDVDAVRLVAALSGVRFAPGDTVAAVTVRGCPAEGQPGFVVEATPSPEGLVAVYSNGELPDRRARFTGEDGIALLWNAAPGPVTLRARRAGTDLVVATADVYLRAGELTFVYLDPYYHD